MQLDIIWYMTQHLSDIVQYGTALYSVWWIGGRTERKGYMIKSLNGNIFRVTGHLCGEFTGPRWIPHTKASDAELWCFVWSAPE